MKRKRYFLPAVLLAILAVLLLLRLGAAPKKPFADLRGEDILSAEVQLIPPEETYAVSDLDELASDLREVVIYGRKFLYPPYAGQACIFTLHLRDGRTVQVYEFSPILRINGAAYKAEYEPCEVLNQLGNRIMEESAPAEPCVDLDGITYYGTGKKLMDTPEADTIEFADMPVGGGGAGIIRGYSILEEGERIACLINGEWYEFAVK